MKGYQLKVFAGRSNPALGKKIITELGIEPGDIEIIDFSDDETFVQINENVRGADVFAVQSLCQPGNANIMELLIMMDAFRRSSAERITAVIPYFAYARQDRKVQPRVPITAKLLANLIVAAGADRIIAMDLHAGQIQGFFDIPTDNLFAAPVMCKDLTERFENGDLMIVSPDVGGVVRARAYAKRCNDAPLAIIDKRRERANESEVMNIIGDVKGRACVIVDDIVDTSGTMCSAADALLEAGAKSVGAYIAHGVLSGDAVERITNSSLENLVITDSIQPTDAVRECKKIRILSVAPLIGEAISRISEETSVSSLFD